MTNKAILEECKRILNSISDFEYVILPKDFTFLMENFSKAPYWEFKRRDRQIVKIQKKPSGSYGNSCFYLIRDDGTSTDFAYRKIFQKNPKLNDVLNAMRNAIDPIISDFRKRFEPFVYEGIEVSRVEDADVDHYDLSFKALADIWIEKHGGIEALIEKVNLTEDNCTTTCFTDIALIEEFVTFHNANTHLRFLPKDVNRAKR